MNTWVLILIFLAMGPQVHILQQVSTDNFHPEDLLKPRGWHMISSIL